MTVEGITIVAPPDSPNTDGIDPSQTKWLLIAHCNIDTGDECIAFKAGGSSRVQDKGGGRQPYWCDDELERAVCGQCRGAK